MSNSGDLLKRPTKKKVTYYLSDDLVRAARMRAARTDRRDSEVIEDALRSHLGFGLLERVWQRCELSEVDAMKLAVSEVHAARGRKRGPGSS